MGRQREASHQVSEETSNPVPDVVREARSISRYFLFTNQSYRYCGRSRPSEGVRLIRMGKRQRVSHDKASRNLEWIPDSRPALGLGKEMKTEGPD